MESDVLIGLNAGSNQPDEDIGHHQLLLLRNELHQFNDPPRRHASHREAQEGSSGMRDQVIQIPGQFMTVMAGMSVGHCSEAEDED